jgi:diguanylate cyclase (GGDEF)-like protein
MTWQLVVVLNLVIAGCYVAIAFLIAQGLVRTRQLSTNPLALATATIFLTCALHHGHHAAHLMSTFGGSEHADALHSVRALFGEWHSVAIDALGALVALTYLALRRSYKALLNTPAMFDDAVRLAAEQQLRDLAYTDQLTGVPNRAAYQRYADHLKDDDRGVIVLFIDLDGFKGINDAYGHDAGDRLLREVAQRVTHGLGARERLFRIGGDEFVVIGIGGAARAAAFAGRVQGLIRQPIQIREGAVLVGASIGVATGSACTGVDHLLRDADADMYRIKNQPRDDVPAQRAESPRRAIPA